jgi:hypothetical protein
MTIIHHPFRGEADMPRILDLILGRLSAAAYCPL